MAPYTQVLVSLSLYISPIPFTWETLCPDTHSSFFLVIILQYPTSLTPDAQTNELWVAKHSDVTWIDSARLV